MSLHCTLPHTWECVCENKVTRWDQRYQLQDWFNEWVDLNLSLMKLYCYFTIYEYGMHNTDISLHKEWPKILEKSDRVIIFEMFLHILFGENVSEYVSFFGGLYLLGLLCTLLCFEGFFIMRWLIHPLHFVVFISTALRIALWWE